MPAAGLFAPLLDADSRWNLESWGGAQDKLPTEIMRRGGSETEIPFPVTPPQPSNHDEAFQGGDPARYIGHARPLGEQDPFRQRKSGGPM